MKYYTISATILLEEKEGIKQLGSRVRVKVALSR